MIQCISSLNPLIWKSIRPFRKRTYRWTWEWENCTSPLQTGFHQWASRVSKLILNPSPIIWLQSRFDRDPRWSETGDRYIIKLFRDYVFHQVDENGAPVVNLSHVLTCLNKVRLINLYPVAPFLRTCSWTQVLKNELCSSLATNRAV